jgi:hypothetical protein
MSAGARMRLSPMPAAFLLADRSPCLRSLVLREVLGRGVDDEEVVELAGLRGTDRLVTDLVALQDPDGSWASLGPSFRDEKLRATAQALMRLGFLGFGPDHGAVRGGAEYLFSQQRPDGSWPLPTSHDEIGEDEGYSMVPLQTAIPLRGLAACGYATDSRAEQAYDWLLAQRLDDGAWPTGLASGNYGYVAGYRRLAHSRWGCRSNTTGALICLALHPDRRKGPEARRALDLLLGRETRERHTLGFEVARLISVEPSRGFFTYYAHFDLALILNLCWRVGATQEDARVAEVVDFVVGLQGPYGLWEYAPRPQASRWVSFDLLRSLCRLGAMGPGEGADWLSAEPRTPFQPYPVRVRRF